MASPQVDKGNFTKLANELLEAMIAADMSKRQYKVALFIIRRTYGFARKADTITYGQIADKTGMRRDHAIQTVKELRDMNIISVSPSGRYAHGQEMNSLAINKDYDAWVTSPQTRDQSKQKTKTQNRDQSPKTGTSTQNGGKLVPETGENWSPKQVPLERKKERKKCESSDSRPRDLVWDALLDACNIDQGELTKSARGACNSAVRMLKDVGASADEIEARADRYRQIYPGAELTPSAMAKHWAQCAPRSRPQRRVAV